MMQIHVSKSMLSAKERYDSEYFKNKATMYKIITITINKVSNSIILDTFILGDPVFTKIYWFYKNFM